MNFYNIIEENYLERKKIEFLKSNYYKYLLFIIVYGFIIGMSSFFFEFNKYFRLAAIYDILIICDSSLIYFYSTKLFKNYYSFNNKNKNDMNFSIFLNANLFSFAIQNIYTEKEGNDYLSINAICAVVDFVCLAVEFIIYEIIKNDKIINIINYISFFVSCVVGLFLLVIIFILGILIFISIFKCCSEDTKKKLDNFLKWLT